MNATGKTLYPANLSNSFQVIPCLEPLAGATSAKFVDDPFSVQELLQSIGFNHLLQPSFQHKLTAVYRSLGSCSPMQLLILGCGLALSILALKNSSNHPILISLIMDMITNNSFEIINKILINSIIMFAAFFSSRKLASA